MPEEPPEAEEQDEEIGDLPLKTDETEEVLGGAIKDNRLPP